jgi:hypothetical protein
VPRHVARLVAPLVVGYSASRRLVVDYFASAARPGDSARRAARHADRHAARRRLLRLLRASGCLGTSCDSSRSSSPTLPRAGSSSTTSPPPRVRVPRHGARLVTRLVAPLVVDYSASQARRRLLLLHRASGCIGTSRGSSRGSSSTTPPRVGSSSTTLPPPRVRVPRHVVRLVTRLVVDYFDYAVRPVASAHCATRCTARHAALVDYFASCGLVVDYFAYAVRPGASARRACKTPDFHRKTRIPVPSR